MGRFYFQKILSVPAIYLTKPESIRILRQFRCKMSILLDLGIQSTMQQKTTSGGHFLLFQYNRSPFQFIRTPYSIGIILNMAKYSSSSGTGCMALEVLQNSLFHNLGLSEALLDTLYRDIRTTTHRVLSYKSVINFSWIVG